MATKKETPKKKRKAPANWQANKGFKKIQKLTKEALIIRENAGSKTETIKVKKYRLTMAEAIHRAAVAQKSKGRQGTLRFKK